MSAQRSFPPGFTWGVATSAYQIEGATDVDGRGESIWDRFCREPGRVDDGHTGDVACDHYHRWEADLDLLAELGVGAYRFSIAWPRIHPDGGTTRNEAGLDFYDRLVDGMLERGIAPAPTLYHWDLPQALQDRGGWADRDTAYRFAEYANTVFERLGDRVRLWMTHNEPWMASFIGHLRGVHAPGHYDLQTALRAAHHLLLSHGLAVEQFRALGLEGDIGIVLNLMPTYPHTDSEADRDAAWGSDGFTNRWFLDPVFRGSYPQDTVGRFERAGGRVDFVEDGDLATMSQPTDFLGVNYYAPRRVSAVDVEFGWKVEEPPPPGVPRTGMDTEIYPEGLTALLQRLQRDYGGIPFYVTENGVPYYDDEVADDGGVHDTRRVDFLRDHFAAAHDAIAAGVDLAGYFVWSFMDNFEWAAGYGPRFGIVHVDYASLARTPKDSFHFYRRVIAANGLYDEESRHV
ncbi:GH1 family beta-glucosidase [Egicoccus sp. AB-alg6-2]|uniref:GH1 family beta-glucosidase n=1 Tax=Egicoccus sp. AB-alg6-2 TaxID=3242692 RepID=UPI00359CF7ED